MNVALFGGTFDPIHRGHITVARAARERFKLDQVHFVPADIPPHKQDVTVASFDHRYAMVVLATQGEKTFVPSLLEAPPRHSNLLAFREDDAGHTAPNYTIHTVRRLKRELPKNARLFFLIGADAFQGIATWRRPEELLEEVEFIVASRPGYSLADVAAALPESRRPRPAALKAFARQKSADRLELPGVTLHLLPEVNEDVSATAVRRAVESGKSVERYLDPAVAAYIRKTHLYAERRMPAERSLRATPLSKPVKPAKVKAKRR